MTHDGLPDTFRPNGLCPRCGKQSSFEELGNLPVTFDGWTSYPANGASVPTHSDRVTVFLCRHCKQGVVVVEEEWIGNKPKTEGIGKGGMVTFRGINGWPLPESKLSSDIPKYVSDIYSEAAIAFYANAFRASAVMLRCTLEAITNHFGITQGVLAKRLEQLSERGILLPTLFEWSKEVRLIGNQGAHYNPSEPISKEEAQQLLDFLRELMKYLFEMPAELDRKRNK